MAAESRRDRQEEKEAMVQRSGSRYTVLKDTHGFTVVDESGEVIRALNGRGYVKNRDKETAERVTAYLNVAPVKVLQATECRRRIVAMDLGENGDILLWFGDGSVFVVGKHGDLGGEGFAQEYHCGDQVPEDSLPTFFFGSSPIGLCPEHHKPRENACPSEGHRMVFGRPDRESQCMHRHRRQGSVRGGRQPR
jgi:hypothetical protein